MFLFILSIAEDLSREEHAELEDEVSDGLALFGINGLGKKRIGAYLEVGWDGIGTCTGRMERGEGGRRLEKVELEKFCRRCVLFVLL